MYVIFDKNAYQEITIEGKGSFIAGGLRISEVPKFSQYELEDEFFSDNTVEPDDLVVGQLVGLTTGEYGAFNKPFVVTEYEEDTDGDSEIQEIIRLGFCGDEDVTEGVILTRKPYAEYTASYYDYQFKGSRFVTSDSVQVYLIPDMILAEIFGGNIKKNILPYSL